MRFSITQISVASFVLHMVYSRQTTCHFDSTKIIFYKLPLKRWISHLLQHLQEEPCTQTFLYTHDCIYEYTFFKYVILSFPKTAVNRFYLTYWKLHSLFALEQTIALLIPTEDFDLNISDRFFFSSIENKGFPMQSHLIINGTVKKITNFPAGSKDFLIWCK